MARVEEREVFIQVAGPIDRDDNDLLNSKTRKQKVDQHVVVMVVAWGTGLPLTCAVPAPSSIPAAFPTPANFPQCLAHFSPAKSRTRVHNNPSSSTLSSSMNARSRILRGSEWIAGNMKLAGVFEEIVFMARVVLCGPDVVGGVEDNWLSKAGEGW